MLSSSGNIGYDSVGHRDTFFFENHLETHGFLRIHRGYMINPNYVKTYNLESESITMTNGFIADIARRRKHILKDLVS